MLTQWNLQARRLRFPAFYNFLTGPSVVKQISKLIYPTVQTCNFEHYTIPTTLPGPRFSPIDNCYHVVKMPENLPISSFINKCFIFLEVSHTSTTHDRSFQFFWSNASKKLPEIIIGNHITPHKYIWRTQTCLGPRQKCRWLDFY